MQEYEFRQKKREDEQFKQQNQGNNRKPRKNVEKVFRHGNRTILKTYKTDPYKSEAWWPPGFGQLTNIGKESQYLLGQYFRRRYRKLIGEGYSKDTVCIESGKEDRNLMSASCVAHGMFPAHGDQVWKRATKWQPIPIHELPPNKQHLLIPQITCLKQDLLYIQYLKSDKIQAKLKKITRLRKFLKQHSGNSCKNLPDLLLIYDALKIEYLRGLPLPEWAQYVWKHERNTLEYFAALTYKGFTSTTELKKISAGFTLKEIFSRFKSLCNTTLKKPKQKIWLYSAHDLTIVNLLNALNVFNPIRTPPFSSSFHFEMKEKPNKEFYVQLFYRRDDSEYLAPIEIPNCGTKCPLDKLTELYADILPSEHETYESACKIMKKKLIH